MRCISKKKAARKAEEAAFKRQLFDEVGVCELCGHDPARAKARFLWWKMELHHIARGTHREKASVERCAVLFLCWRCHNLQVHGVGYWPEARQLAVLRRSRLEDYDLDKYNALIGWGPDRISEDDVDAWMGRLITAKAKEKKC